MTDLLFLASLMIAASATTTGAQPDLDAISEGDAIACRLDAPTYQRLAFAIEGEEKLATRRGWKKLATRNAALLEYELPAPITVSPGYSTRRIAFTGNGVLAILDLADPGAIASREKIANAADAEPMIAAMIAPMVAAGKFSRAEAQAALPFRKFLGERVISDVTVPAAGKGDFGTHTVIARTISNAVSHPGKTFYGCAYRVDVVDDTGAPL